MIRDGYHLIQINLLYRHKTAFVCRYSAFEYTVMTFEFKNAPAHFQKTMNLMLRDVIDKCILVYLDNILIFLCNKAEQEEYVHLVFERLT